MKGVADLLILVLNLELKQLVTFLPHTSLETPEFVHKQIFAVAQSLKAEYCCTEFSLSYENCKPQNKIDTNILLFDDALNCAFYN